MAAMKLTEEDDFPRWMRFECFIASKDELPCNYIGRPRHLHRKIHQDKIRSREHNDAHIPLILDDLRILDYQRLGEIGQDLVPELLWIPKRVTQTSSVYRGHAIRLSNPPTLQLVPIQQMQVMYARIWRKEGPQRD
ncbi:MULTISPECIES: hypothetical protein [Streptomyces]|uniref:hypothetical protein n=1 Tax=Streptomyces TaxID=1883 RepID=UPI00131CF035|nr:MULTISPECIES: hypothetical protein [Streptomyces]